MTRLSRGPGPPGHPERGEGRGANPGPSPCLMLPAATTHTDTSIVQHLGPVGPPVPGVWQVAPERPARDIWTEAFKFGWACGYEQGADDIDAREDRYWAAMARWVRGSANSPSHRELVRRRGDDRPCPRKCRQCAACQRSLAYWGRK